MQDLSLKIRHIRAMARFFGPRANWAAGVLAITLLILPARASYGVPDISGMRVTDVTPASFAVVWMTDISADPGVEVYLDSSMTRRITDSLVVSAMSSIRSDVAQAAKDKGIMKVRVSGLDPAVRYYVKAVTRETSNPSNIAYSPLWEVVTASAVTPYTYAGSAPRELSNDLADFRVYVRPSDTTIPPRMGDLIVLESPASPYPISSFVGDGSEAPEGILDMNNLFGPDGKSLFITGDEKVILTVYRGEALSELIHYRFVPANSGMVKVSEPAKGFFADFNLDGNVDDLDFSEFKKQYRALPDDAHYNPDFDFVDDADHKVDAREFSKFSREYGRTDVR